MRAALAALQDADGGNRRQENRLPSRCSCFIPIGAHHYNLFPFHHSDLGCEFAKKSLTLQKN